MRGSWRPNRTTIYWPPLLWPSALCLSRSPGQLNRRPMGPALYWMMAFFTASYQQLLWSPTQSGAPSPFGLVWLSLPHLDYNSVRSLTAWHLSWLSYIIVQRPLNRPLNPWNGMFDRHQAEITVMQFRGQSMSVSWDFTLSHFVSQFLPTWSLSITGYWDVSLPSGASLWNSILAGSKVKIQQSHVPDFCSSIPSHR